ncbi:MAG: VanZ family protein [Cyclobacteriaceae bacterium]|nr:VanZ family protein [Cyclobacteriaceae bacterium]
MFIRYNLFAIVWACVIFLLILMPGKQLPDTGNLFSIDKIAHFGVFAILSFLMIVGFAKQKTNKDLNKLHALYGLGISMFYASVLELSQAVVPDRQMSMADLIANTLGVIAGYLLFLLIYKFSFR